MTTWTPTARLELENHLNGLRHSLARSGADPDEVLDDLRRHVDEEATAAHLAVVTEADVQRLVAQVAPRSPFSVKSRERRDEWADEPFPYRDSDAGFGREATTGPARSNGRPRGSAWARGVKVGSLIVFGVLLPLFTLLFELWTRACAEEIFDPLPTRWHALLVALVPLASTLALWPKRRGQPGWWRSAWILNGMSMGIGAAYTVPFLPLLPFALIGVVFGIGFLPLAPTLGLICTEVLRRRLIRDAPGGCPMKRGTWWLAFAFPWLLLAFLAAPPLATRHFARIALGENRERSAAAMEWLRNWGDRDTLLRDCYGYRRGLWDEVLPESLSEDAARQLYFRVTGQPFNAVTPPETARSRRNRMLFDELEPGAVEWDSALGGEAVAGRVRGLALTGSRLDALADADAAWSYVEWTLEFRNDHVRSQREARAQIQLPPGGVVSRLTLWVNGEEREAAFAGRSQVREAYQKVAVQQRRDPVLVTTCGTDRVLVQCFPVPPNGGTMKVRLGITAPLTLVSAEEAAMKWPQFLERNFALGPSLEHGVWLESQQAPIELPSGLLLAPDGQGRSGIHGQWSDAALGEPQRTVRLRRDPTATTTWSVDRRSAQPGWIRQRIVPVAATMPARVALVLDASESMNEKFSEIAAALEVGPAKPEFGLFVAREGVQRLHVDRTGYTAADAVRQVSGAGGQDDLPALVQAWEWAAAEPGGVVLWIHGPQPVLLSSVDPLRQRLEWRNGGGAPLLLDFQTVAGPNRIAENLDGLESVATVPRMGGVQEDLERFLATWSGRAPSFTFQRERLTGEPDAAARLGEGGSSHLIRLWANSEARRLWRQRFSSAAAEFAARYQLVTPASGAVVLETREQYQQSGLQPVDPATVPIVPEPGVFPLMVLGGVLLLVLRRNCSRRHDGAS